MIGDYHKPSTRLPGAGGAPEIAASCSEVLITLRQNKRAFVEQARFRHVGRTSRRRRQPRQAAISREGSDGGDHRSRHSHARSGDQGADADQRASRRHASSRSWRRPAGRSRSRRQVETTEPPTAKELAVLRDLQARTAKAHAGQA